MKASCIAVLAVLLALPGLSAAFGDVSPAEPDFHAAAPAGVPSCLPGPNRLCLGEGRFQLETSWTAPEAGAGAGHAVTLTRDTGYFWFFGEENVELMVKVLDARTLNRHFWVFYGSLSNVAWRLTVTDTVTGNVKVYDNPAGQLASHGDTAALPGSASVSASDNVELHAFEAVHLDREAFPAPFEVPAEPVEAVALPSFPAKAQTVGPCTFDVPTTTVVRPGLCLNGERFEVEVSWVDPFNHTSGVGQGVGLTADSGYFWFFHPANVELVVKVLDAREVNGKFWVFYGALTNVEYTIKVRHFDGPEQTYHNPPFQFLSRADVDAFEPPGCTCPSYVASVCGKDGLTYANECEAYCSGWVYVDHFGSCRNGH